ncbi:hypothetical protein AVEN_62643-1 [Araneus ventricosus]|uniref:RNA polymerase II subunit B1 CTD phosphatase RPAP2 homolog n=1 Tax=Araneus ventricosus TaxID=182803 RepID=A0A4Y2RSP4_ARAVE|nr:hypothetical protein AVEN_62643-1 [Araneus ventricosus]
MPPKRKQKAKTEKQSEKDKNFLSMKEKVLEIKRNVLKAVELMLEENVSKNWFLENCSKLCKQDYADVIQERSIEHVCGYPLCDNPIVTVSCFYIVCSICLVVT